MYIRSNFYTIIMLSLNYVTLYSKISWYTGELQLPFVFSQFTEFNFH